jgi:RimJ/RimL family protein N-acetyltransferase
MNDTLTVREISESDVSSLADYWTNAAPDFLVSMGVDLARMPARPDFVEMIRHQLHQNYPDKKSYAIIWLDAGVPFGHCNVNKIIFGNEAYMHLHLWDASRRKKGFGTKLVKMSLPYFFKNCRLRTLYCEPYALNEAPNRTLKKAGFEFVKKYRTVPGFLNFEQDVNQWRLTLENFSKML